MEKTALFPSFVTVLVSSLTVSLPWLLLGIVLSSTFLIWTDEEKWIANFPRNRLLSSLVGSVLGFILPVGALGSIPLARRLLLQGAPIPLVVSFLVAAPTLNLLMLAEILFGPQIEYQLIVLQLAMAWLMAITLGLVFSPYQVARQRQEGEEETPLINIPLLRSGALIPLRSESEEEQRPSGVVFAAGVNPINAFSRSQKLQLFGRNIIEEFQEFGGMLVLGTAIAAGLALLVSQTGLLQWAGQIPVRQTLVMMGWGVILPLGTFNDQSLVVPLLEEVWLGAILAFLLLGSVVNLQTLALWSITFRWRPLFYLLMLVGLFVFLFAMVTNYYLT